MQLAKQIKTLKPPFKWWYAAINAVQVRRVCYESILVTTFVFIDGSSLTRRVYLD